MKALKKSLLAAQILLLFSFPVMGDMFSDSHSCSKPYKPFEFDSQSDVDQFKSEVRRYKECILEFIEEQKEEIIKHEEAVEEATDEWNSFVSYELN